jgi:hypothetical protein
MAKPQLTYNAKTNQFMIGKQAYSIKHLVYLAFQKNKNYQLNKLIKRLSTAHADSGADDTHTGQIMSDLMNEWCNASEYYSKQEAA